MGTPKSVIKDIEQFIYINIDDTHGINFNRVSVINNIKKIDSMGLVCILIQHEYHKCKTRKI